MDPCIRFLLVRNMWKDLRKWFSLRCKIIYLPKLTLHFFQHGRVRKFWTCVGNSNWKTFTFDFFLKIPIFQNFQKVLHITCQFDVYIDSLSSYRFFFLHQIHNWNLYTRRKERLEILSLILGSEIWQSGNTKENINLIDLLTLYDIRNIVST